MTLSAPAYFRGTERDLTSGGWKHFLDSKSQAALVRLACQQPSASEQRGSWQNATLVNHVPAAEPHFMVFLGTAAFVILTAGFAAQPQRDTYHLIDQIG